MINRLTLWAMLSASLTACASHPSNQPTASVPSIRQDINNKLQQAFAENERQFELLNQLQQSNGKGVRPQQELVSPYYAPHPYTKSETVSMLRHGTLGQAPVQAKILLTGADTQAFVAPAPNLDDTPTDTGYRYQPSTAYQTLKKSSTPATAPTVHYSATSCFQHLSRYENQMKPLTSPAFVPPTAIVPKKQGKSYLSPPKTAISHIVKPKSVSPQASIPPTATLPSANAKMGKQLSFKGEYQLNELLLKIAKETGYQLHITDPQDKAKKMKLNIKEAYNGTYQSALSSLNQKLKNNQAGSISVNHKTKSIHATYH